jgi:hypothetical protein
MKIGFTPGVLRHFAFLETDYSFRCVYSSSQDVRWEDSVVFVDLRFDSQRSYELYLSVGRLAVLVDGQHVPFGLDEISRFGGGAWGSWAVHARDEGELDERLREVASILKDVGQRFLLTDAQAFAELAVQRQRECTEYALNKALLRARIG